MTDGGIGYVHGFSDVESARLQAQAWSVRDLVHSESRYAPGERVLEVGCGTGAQTVTLAARNPGAQIVSVDSSRKSLDEARTRVKDAGLTNVEFHEADLFALPFPAGSFDHAFVCFVLEHLREPAAALAVVREQVRPGGTIFVFEGDHGSTYFHPDSAWAQQAVHAQVELQRRAGGNAMIGRQLYPLLCQAGFADVAVEPKMIYVDGSDPDLITNFTRRTFVEMIAGAREDAVRIGLIDAPAFDRGIDDLNRTAEPDGVFCYTFFRGLGRV